MEILLGFSILFNFLLGVGALMMLDGHLHKQPSKRE